MRFGNPQAFWYLLALPAFAGLYVWSFRARRVALERFGAPALMQKLTSATSRPRQVLKAILMLAFFVLVCLALVEPRFGSRTNTVHRRGVDVLIALDTSLSMLAEDIRPNRLLRARYEIESFIDRLEGDRVGLVAFAGQSFVLCPLTLDYGAAKLFLDSVDTGLIPSRGTAIAGAIQTATRAFGGEDRKHKALILITDGEDHAGNPTEAAEVAAEAGVRIFCVGIGTREGELIPIRSDGRVDFLKDDQGHVVKTRLDEPTLQQIAQLTDGGYVRSQSGGVGLEEVYAQISAMEKKDLGTRTLSQYRHRYQWPLALALICLIAESFLSDRRRSDLVWHGRFES